ncbi:MAG: hypothetical protein LUI87_12755 [Lachnospiraceae bacterium]|nr:hypothetical protein [Lachnospiraceae bacterium]
MYIDKQKWDIILDGLHLTDKEKIVAEAIKALLNQATKPKEIMESVIVSTDEENIAVDKLELADMINAALGTLIFMLEDDEQEAPEKGDDVDARLRETAFDMIEDIDGYDFVQGLGCSYDEMLNGCDFAEFLIRVQYVVNL